MCPCILAAPEVLPDVGDAPGTPPVCRGVPCPLRTFGFVIRTEKFGIYDDRHVLSWFPRRGRSSRQLRFKCPLSELVEMPVEIAVPMTRRTSRLPPPACAQLARLEPPGRQWEPQCPRSGGPWMAPHGTYWVFMRRYLGAGPGSRTGTWPGVHTCHCASGTGKNLTANGHETSHWHLQAAVSGVWALRQPPGAGRSH